MKTFYFLMLSLSFYLNCFSQKPFNMVYYTGKTDRYTITLIYADGYSEASKVEVVITKSKYKFSTNVATEFLDTSNDLRFNHYSSTGVKFSDYILIKGMNRKDRALPNKVYGFYSFKDTKYKFVLKRK